MAVDVALALDTGQTVTADGSTDYIECEGGFLAWFHMYWGVMSGGSTTCDAYLMVSIDAGANYYMKGKVQQVGPSDDSKEDRVPVYIPQPATAGNKVRVRVKYEVAGGSPSYAVTRAQLEPMTSLAVPAIDEQMQTGAASLIAAV